MNRWIGVGVSFVAAMSTSLRAEAFEACYQRELQALWLADCVERELNECTAVRHSLADGGVEFLAADSAVDAGCVPLREVSLRRLGVTGNVAPSRVTFTREAAHAIDRDDVFANCASRAVTLRKGSGAFWRGTLPALGTNAAFSAYEVPNGRHAVLVYEFTAPGNEGSQFTDRRFTVVRLNASTTRCAERDCLPLLVNLAVDPWADRARCSRAVAAALTDSPERSALWLERAREQEVRAALTRRPGFSELRAALETWTTNFWNPTTFPTEQQQLEVGAQTFRWLSRVPAAQWPIAGELLGVPMDGGANWPMVLEGARRETARWRDGGFERADGGIWQVAP